MKIISFNLAGRSNFGKDYSARIQSIIDFIDRENADVVCMQEVTTSQHSSLAERINDGLKNPYPFVSAHMSEKYTYDKFSAPFLEKWRAGLIEHYDDYSNDGMAILSREPISRDTSIVMKPAPADERGKANLRVRVSQIVKLESGISIANVHFATNNNAYLQLQELIEYRKRTLLLAILICLQKICRAMKIFGQHTTRNLLIFKTTFLSRTKMRLSTTCFWIQTILLFLLIRLMDFRTTRQ